MMRAVLLPTGPMDRTVDVDLDLPADADLPANLAVATYHGQESLVHDGTAYTVEGGPALRLWSLAIALPGGLGVYQLNVDNAAVEEPFPVVIREKAPAARFPREILASVIYGDNPGSGAGAIAGAMAAMDQARVARARRY